MFSISRSLPRVSLSLLVTWAWYGKDKRALVCENFQRDKKGKLPTFLFRFFFFSDQMIPIKKRYLIKNNPLCLAVFFSHDLLSVHVYS